ENEAQVVHVAVELPRLQRLRIAHGLLPPQLRVRSVGRDAVQDPEQAWQEAVAPVRPAPAGILPPALHGVHRIEVGMPLDQRAQLLPGEIESVFEQSAVVLSLELNHFGHYNGTLRNLRPETLLKAASFAYNRGLSAPSIDYRFACFRMVLSSSPIHRWGVFAA